jgi:hypothetical protein
MDLPRLIVLRIWADSSRFRAVVRELEPEQTHCFTDPIELLAFLRRVSDEPNAALPPTCLPPTP